MYKKNGIDGKNRIIGLSNIDTIRASSFLNHHLQIRSDEFLCLPVIGGHSESTIIPLFSQLNKHIRSQIDILYLTKEIQHAGDTVVNAKEGQGSATLAVAYAAAKFTDSLLRAMNGERNIIEPAFIEQEYQGTRFFSSYVKLGKWGVEEPLPIPQNLTAFEKENLQACLPILNDQIQKGIDYVNKHF